nr:ATP-dependent DNA helicase PIF1-like [Tanacetum cinerariifolium]
TLLFDTMLVLAAKEVGLIQANVQSTTIPTEPSTSKPHKKHKSKKQQTQAPKVPSPEPLPEHRLPSPSNDPLPGGEDSLKLKELKKFIIEKLEGRVAKLEEENRVLMDLHSVHSKVDTAALVVEKEKSFKQGRIIVDIDEDVEINLKEAQAKLYRIDLENPQKVLSMQDVDDEEPANKVPAVDLTIPSFRTGIINKAQRQVSNQFETPPVESVEDLYLSVIIFFNVLHGIAWAASEVVVLTWEFYHVRTLSLPFENFRPLMYQHSCVLSVMSLRNNHADRPSLSNILHRSFMIHSKIIIRRDRIVQSFCGLKLSDIGIPNRGTSSVPAKEGRSLKRKPIVDTISCPFSHVGTRAAGQKQLVKRTRKSAALSSSVLYVIEFQKRGLPHTRILLWLEEHCKCKTPDHIDDIISAKLPLPMDDPIGYKAVTDYMLHGPCRKDVRYVVCNVEGKRSKHFPKAFCAETIIDQDEYPIYRQRDNKMCVKKERIQNYCLVEIQELLNRNGRTLAEFQDMPQPNPKLLTNMDNHLIREALAFDMHKSKHEHQQLHSQPGDTGKTFLYKTIISRLRSGWKIILVVASSGIASLLLPARRTAHSRFIIPLELLENSIRRKVEHPLSEAYAGN